MHPCATPKPPIRAHWSLRMPVTRIETGRRLRLLLDAPAAVRWSTDRWASAFETPTHYSGLNLHVAEMPTRALARGQHVTFH